MMNVVHRVVIDCDPGIDDALALLLAAASPELELLGVTCVAGNRPLDVSCANACGVLHLAGRDDVPVFAGCARPLGQPTPRCTLVHGEGGLGGVALPSSRSPGSQHAVDFLADMLAGQPEGTVTLVAVGPLTNLALVEIKQPGLLRRARTVAVMGGAAFGPGNITPSAEFNFHADPLAAHVVLGSGATIALFGLDVTRQARMQPAWIESLAALQTRAACFAHQMLSGYAAREPLLHDACPVAWLLQPALFDAQRCSVAVEWRAAETEGRLCAGPPSDAAHGQAQVFTRVQGDALLALVRQRLAQLD